MKFATIQAPLPLPLPLPLLIVVATVASLATFCHAFQVHHIPSSPAASILLGSRRSIMPNLALAASAIETTAENVDADITAAKEILNKAADSKKEDPEIVMEALLKLEKLMRQKAKEEQQEGTISSAVGEEIKSQLHGNWRLIFTTGTANTQNKYGKINYFPIKAVQTFRTQNRDPMKISNGIFVGDFPVVKFSGDMDFDIIKRKLEFDFTELLVFNFLKINLGKGDAAKIGASTGLGSESNVANAKKGRQAFFNWISADENIATARGGGGGLALWKRIPMEDEEEE